MKQVKLDKIAEVFTGARLERFNSNSTQIQPVIRKIYTNNQIDYEDEKISIKLNDKFYTQKGDILIQLREPNIIIKANQEGLIVPMNFGVIRIKEGYDSNYIYHVLKNDVIPKNLKILIEGSILQTIRTNYLKELKIPILDNNEKQKDIGNLLNLIDKKSELHEKLTKTNDKLKNAILKNCIAKEE